MTTKLFERLVTKFSIKANDIAKYLESSKATIYNYRNLENFSDIPSDKQLKIFYLFGKNSIEELELVLDESDNDLLAKYMNRITSILKESVQTKINSISSIESMNEEIEKLNQELLILKRQLALMQQFDGVDEFTKTILFNKIAKIIDGANTAEIRLFLDYLDIFEKYHISNL